MIEFGLSGSSATKVYVNPASVSHVLAHSKEITVIHLVTGREIGVKADVAVVAQRLRAGQ